MVSKDFLRPTFASVQSVGCKFKLCVSINGTASQVVVWYGTIANSCFLFACEALGSSSSETSSQELSRSRSGSSCTQADLRVNEFVSCDTMKEGQDDKPRSCETFTSTAKSRFVLCYCLRRRFSYTRDALCRSALVSCTYTRQKMKTLRRDALWGSISLISFLLLLVCAPSCCVVAWEYATPNECIQACQGVFAFTNEADAQKCCQYTSNKYDSDDNDPVGSAFPTMAPTATAEAIVNSTARQQMGNIRYCSHFGGPQDTKVRVRWPIPGFQIEKVCVCNDGCEMAVCSCNGDCCDCDVLCSSSHYSFNSRGSAFLVVGLESKGIDVDQEQCPSSIHTRGMYLA